MFDCWQQPHIMLAHMAQMPKLQCMLTSTELIRLPDLCRRQLA
jgi:hypothetical protein